MTETDHDLSTIEHLDFSSELECDLDDCLNIATWSKEYLCCARELKSCNECRMRAFAQWRAEALLEGAPDIARTTTAPGGANLVVTIARTLWLLEEDLQHTTEIVDLRRAAVAHLIPETTGAEALHHGQFDVAQQRDRDKLRAPDVIKRLPDEEDIAIACIRAEHRALRRIA